MNYLIRNINDDLWRKFKARCALEGITVRDWIIRTITNYINSITHSK